MELHQEIKLIDTGKAGVSLVRVTSDNEGRVIRYEHLDSTPIHPSSDYYDEYLKAKMKKGDLSEIIKRYNLG